MRSKLVDHATYELRKNGIIGSGEPYNDMLSKAILDLIELFDSQCHSGFSGPYVINAFRRLALFLPLSPTASDAEEVSK